MQQFVEVRERRPDPSPGLFGGWLAIYLAIPFVALGIYVVYSGFGSAPGLWQATYVSVVTATLTTLLLVVFGLPLASYMAHTPTKLARLMKVVVRLPLGIPPLVSGIMLLIAFGPYSFIGRYFGGHLVNSMIAIVLAQLFVEMPFVIEGARAAFSGLDPDVFEVSHMLAVPSWRRLVGIELPLSIRSVRTAVMMGWLRAFGEFGATVLVAYHPTSLPVLIYTQFSGTGLRSAILPVGAVLVVSSIAVALITRLRPPSKAALGIGSAGTHHVDLVSSERSLENHGGKIGMHVEGQAGSFKLKSHVEARSSSVALIGPSGAGKSMTVRAISGLVPGFSAKLDLAGIDTPTVAFVPQGQGLFSHLDVYGQIALAVRWARQIKGNEEMRAEVNKAASQVGIGSLLARKVSTLSGGQRQRVALARAIASSPDLLILDEPFSALDRPQRDRQIRFVRSLVRDLNIYLIVVTHEIAEAAFLADSLAVINDGRIVASGSFGDLLRDPKTPEVARILGYENLLSVRRINQSTFEVISPAPEDSPEIFFAFRDYGHEIALVRKSSAKSNFVNIKRNSTTPETFIMNAVVVLRDRIDLGDRVLVILELFEGTSFELKVSTADWSLELNDRVELSVVLRCDAATLVEN